ncbi:hypothetical protein BG004_003360 [Podila humilis]|nr:hypothetical protein BG004_003360 [Podila humilis]
MALPESEENFVKNILAIPCNKRVAAAQGLVLDKGDQVIPLLREILTTAPLVHSIPIVQPPAKGVELAEDGSNPNPVLVTESLRFPQTNAPTRYMQRELAIGMAITLATATGSKDAIALLLSVLVHPSTIGKKNAVQCLAKLASDDDLLTASRSLAPSVRDSLVATLKKNKRKTLASDILCKPRKATSTLTSQQATTTRFRKALEKAKDYDRSDVWKEYAKLIDPRNQPKPNLCEEGENIKDVILTLQETMPPFYTWDNSHPERRQPKLSIIIHNHLMTFLRFDAERVLEILKTASWYRRQAIDYHYVNIPSMLTSGSKATSFWCHRKDDGKALRGYWLHMMQIGQGHFVKYANLPYKEYFVHCRAPVLDELVREALKILDTDTFKSLLTSSRHKAEIQLNNILDFAVEGVRNLVARLAGCSAIKDRTDSAVYFQSSLRDLLALVLANATSLLRQLYLSDTAFSEKLYYRIIHPLNHPTADPKRWDADNSSPFKTYPPLGQQLFDEIQAIFKPKSRMETHILSAIEDLLFVLAPRDSSVYALPGLEIEQPFSSIPPWDNTAVFSKCFTNSLNRTGKNPVQMDTAWVVHFDAISKYLTNAQKDEIAQWVISTPNLKALLHETQGSAIFSLLDSIFTNVDLRHQFVLPLVFVDKKEKEVDLGDNQPAWAAYVDIRIPDVRTLLVKETIKPSFEERLLWIQAIIKATQLTRSVHEWIMTLKWLIPRMRNEISPNLTLLMPCMRANYPWVPRQYLDDATLEQAVELEALYLKMDSQNAAAISPVHAVSEFTGAVAKEAFRRFISKPDHPFFRLGHEIPWRSKLMAKGERGALKDYSLSVSTPNYYIGERHEETEIERRREEALEEEDLETQGQGRGTANIPLGMEEEIVTAKLNIYHARWLSVKHVMDPDVDGTDMEAFKKAQPTIFQAACYELHDELGWKWKESATLVAYMEQVLDQLERASTKTFGLDKVLDWSTDEQIGDSANRLGGVFSNYTDEWLLENGHTLPSYTRHHKLRLRSTQAKAEAEERLEKCVLKNGKRDSALFEKEIKQLLEISPSAICLSQVRDYLSKERPDLLEDEQLNLTLEIIGLFNQSEEAEPWNFFVVKVSKLTPQQCDILKARYMLGMKDAGTPLATRVLHAEYFVALPSTTIQDVAEALATPSLPSRISEALLMYLPTLSEPGVTLPLLLASVYLQSHMARTSIYAVENALKHVPLNDVPEYIVPLFPSAKGRQQKVTVQKEGVRLATKSMTLFADPRIRGLFKDLWGRDDLNVDVRSVILQSMLDLLFSPEAKESKFSDDVDWIWQVLVETANSDTHKKSGAALVLVATCPSETLKTKDIPDVPGHIDRTAVANATLSDLAVVKIPEVHVNRYVDEILIPMASKISDPDDEELVEVRNLALQCLVGDSRWITATNAARLAKEWRTEATKLSLEEDPKELWQLYVHGVRKCIGREVAGAQASGQEAMVSWRELIGLIQDLASRFVDKSLTRTQRRKAFARIEILNLGWNFMFQGFDKVDASVFHGKESDLMQPLMDKALEAAMWKTAIAREIQVFKPSKPMTEAEIEQGILEILLRIAHFSNQYVTRADLVSSWVGTLFNKYSAIRVRKFFIATLLEPREELMDWVHLSDATFAVLIHVSRVASLSDISHFIEREATQDYATFYWTNHTRIGTLLSAEMNRLLMSSPDLTLSDKNAKLIKTAVEPLVKRAQVQGWTQGVDAKIVKTLTLNNSITVMHTLFPHLVGPMMHNYIVNVAQNIIQDNNMYAYLTQFVSTPSTAMAKQSRQAVHNPFWETLFGLPPLTALVLEAFMNSGLEDLDLTNALSSHNVPDEVLYGYLYPFQAISDKTADFKGHDNPKTLKHVKARWNDMMTKYGSSFKTVERGVAGSRSRTLSPLAVHAYRTHTMQLMEEYPKFVAIRPFEYLEHVRLNLTAPGSTLSVVKVAEQISAAFKPEQEGSDRLTYGWAPPLSLALDLIEYLMKEIRAEVEIEDGGDSVRETNGGPRGVEALQARYLALVEELCEDGSGGQSIALQLGDFVPGGEKSAADMFEPSDDDYDSDYDE